MAHRVLVLAELVRHLWGNGERRAQDVQERRSSLGEEKVSGIAISM